MEEIPNGVIEDPRTKEEKAKDYIAGVESPIVYEARVEDWNDYLPNGVPQSIPGVFDTNACTHFASIQSVESQIKWLWKNGKLSKDCTDFLSQYGNKDTFVCSKRFNAILGGNTPLGNYFQKAWDTIRHDGLIPDSMLPFGGNNWQEYHNPALITEEMKAIGQKFLQFFEVKYDWVVGYDGMPNFNPTEIYNNKTLIKQCPLNIGVPLNVSHSVIMTKFDDNADNFDHYEPFHRVNDPRPIGLAIRGVVIPVTVPPLQRILKLGMSGADVKLLQSNLRKLGYFSFPTDTGFFGTVTLKAIKKFQLDNKIPQTGNYGELTHAKIYKLLTK